ncbi:cadherin-17 [Varanus komodoensis]|uniref:cadherin-17 n=1 Tax=Varanus komodoensis TaxID=61221 RepID=UPI001CF7C6A2|nr:cadherin-17 [Varanus komodoensis]
MANQGLQSQGESTQIQMCTDKGRDSEKFPRALRDTGGYHQCGQGLEIHFRIIVHFYAPGIRTEGLTMMFKLFGLHLLCLFVLQQVACQSVNQSQFTGPLENKNFTVQEGRLGTIYLYRFAFEPPVVNLRLTGETDNVIQMTPTDGTLFLTGPLNWESKNVHRLQVEGLNEKGQTVKGPYSILIIVEDINDNPPQFDQKNYTGVVRQRSRPGKPFMFVRATDHDDPSTPHAQLSYSIVQHFPSPHKEMYFQINNITGAISTTVAGAKYLDPEKEAEFLLVVAVNDMAGQSINSFATTTDVHIIVMENLWKSPPPVTIKENSTEAHPKAITKVQWNDPGAIYEVTQRKGAVGKLPFMVDKNGTVYVTEPLDREEKDLYTFFVFAKDEQGAPLAFPLNITVTVEDINDNPPVCDKAVTKFEVQENEAAGNLVGHFQASDRDKKDSLNSRLKYKILNQIPKVPLDNLFRIATETGTINLVKAGLSKQVASNYLLKVEVTDTDFTTVCDVQINVIDMNDQIPIFEKTDYGSLVLPENTPVGTVILEIQATDADEPSTGSSEIVYIIKKGDPSNSFTIVTDSKTNKGSVTINKALDFETMPVFDLMINATNPEPLVSGVQYNSSSVAYLRVNVTDVDEPPAFINSVEIVDKHENVSVGSLVTTVTAYDPEGAQIRYSLKGDNRNWLRIDPLNGTIYTAAPLDRETERAYIVYIVATEQTKAAQSSTAKLILNLKDVNDNHPMLSKEFAYFCHPLQGNEKALIEVYDPDQYSFLSRFTYSLVGGDTIQNNWNVSKLNGKHAYIFPKNKSLEAKRYVIPIKINDNAQPPMEGIVYLTVNICRCVEERCFIEVEKVNNFPTVGMAVGILIAVFAVIGIILGIVFYRMKYKKQDDQKAPRASAANPTELQNLT